MRAMNLTLAFLELCDKSKAEKHTVSLLDFVTILNILHTRTLPICPVSQTYEHTRSLHQMASINTKFNSHKQQVKELIEGVDKTKLIPKLLS